MKVWKLIAFLLGGLVLASAGLGFITGSVLGSGRLLIVPILIGLVLCAGGIGLMSFGYRRIAESDADTSWLEMVFGDMTDPVQRAIIMRIIAAGALHGMVVVWIVSSDIVPVAWHDGGIAGAEWLTLGGFALFALTMVWIIWECIRFYNIDEFWHRIILIPASLAGVILLVMTVLWGLAENILSAPRADFWVYYLLYYVSIMTFLIGRWRKYRVHG